MIYKTCQSIILLKDNIDTYQKKKIIKKITKFMQQYSDKIKITEIENNYNKNYIAIEFRILIRGYKKRINKIIENLNTYSEVENFKILGDKEENYNKNSNEIYIVYEFDYGSIKEKIEARSTIFGAYKDRYKAEKKAYSLLLEGLEQYYLSDKMTKLNNPFTIYDKVELYEKEDKDKQKESVYYIKIEKINLE